MELPSPLAVTTGAGEPLALADGTQFVTWAEVLVRGRRRNKEQVLEPTGPLVRVRVEVDNGRPVLAAFGVERDAAPLTATVLHGLNVDAIFRDAVAAISSSAYAGAFDRRPGRGTVTWEPGAHDAAVSGALEAVGRRALTDDFLRRVAEIAKANPLRAHEAIDDEFHAAQRTISRWMAAARERGFLPPLEGKRRGPHRRVNEGGDDGDS